MPKLTRTELYLREILAVLMHAQSRADGVLRPALDQVWELLPPDERRLFRSGVEAAIHSLDKRQEIDHD